MLSTELEYGTVHCAPPTDELEIDPYKGIGSFVARFEKAYERWCAERAARLEELVRELEGQGVLAEVVISKSHAPQGILEVEEQRGACLVVMASHGRSGFKKFWHGSRAASVLNKARCPVLVIKVPEA